MELSGGRLDEGEANSAPKPIRREHKGRLKTARRPDYGQLNAQDGATRTVEFSLLEEKVARKQRGGVPCSTAWLARRDSSLRGRF